MFLYISRTLCYALSSCSSKELSGSLSGYKGGEVYKNETLKKRKVKKAIHRSVNLLIFCNRDANWTLRSSLCVMSTLTTYFEIFGAKIVTCNPKFKYQYLEICKCDICKKKINLSCSLLFNFAFALKANACVKNDL